MNAEQDQHTQTDNAGKIDFVDSVLYCSAALGVDAFGMIPVVGEVISPLGVMTFRLFFWLKGVQSPVNNSMMGISAGSEVIPAVSEVLPGCTAYVLTICLTSNLDKVGSVARTVAKVAPAPQVKAVAAGVAAASDVAQGEDVQSAVTKEASSAMSGGAGGAAGAGAATAQGSAGAAAASRTGGQGSAVSAGDQSAQAGGTVSASEPGGFTADVDLAAQANREVQTAGGDLGSGVGKQPAGGAIPEVATSQGGRFAAGSPVAPDEGPIVRDLSGPRRTSKAGSEKRRDKPTPREKTAPKEPQLL